MTRDAEANLRMKPVDGMLCPRCNGVLTREVTKMYDESRKMFCMVCTHVWPVE